MKLSSKTILKIKNGTPLEVWNLEDQKDTRETIHEIVENAGYKTKSFTHPIQAIQFYKNSNDAPDVIVSDLNYVVDGERSLLELMGDCDEFKNIPIVVSSGDITPERQRELERTFNFCLTPLLKPYEYEEVLDRIKLVFGLAWSQSIENDMLSVLNASQSD